MLDRRRFTFGMLLGIGVATTASAGIPEVQQQGPKLKARYTVAQQGKTLEVRLFLTNTSSEPLSMVLKRGSRSGSYLQAQRLGAPADEQLAEIVNVDRKDMMSRIGPRPEYGTVAAGAEIDAGTFRFETPEGKLGSVVLVATVYLAETYEGLELPAQTLPVGDGKTGV